MSDLLQMGRLAKKAGKQLAQTTNEQRTNVLADISRSSSMNYLPANR